MGNDPTNYPQAGNYLDLPSHGGQSDDGAFMWPGGNSNSVVEFVCSGPHGLRTGDLVNLTVNASPPYPLFFPTDGHAPQTLTGNNVSAATGSTAIIFTNPVTLNAAEIITFDGNASGLAYKVSSGSGTTYFIYPAYSGASASNLTVTRTSAAAIFGGQTNIAVTGPDTFAFLTPAPINLGNTTANPSTLTRVNRMAGTSQIPLSASGALSGTAAITHNTSTVTLTAAQFNQIGMSWVFSGDTTNTPYVVTKCTLSATAAVNTSSTSVTTSASVSGQIGQTWTFTGDSSGKTYVVTAGSGTSWTISPAYAGSTNLTAAAVSTSGGDVHWTIFGTYTGVTVTASTITSSMTFLAHPFQSGMTLTYGFAAHVCAQLPACTPWIPMGAYMSDACIRAIADEMAPYMPANSSVIAESGLEHWNFPSYPVGWLNEYYANLMQYVPPNQVVNTYFTNPATPGVLSRDQAYVLTAAHMHDVLQAQFDTHGKGIQVIRMFGAFGGDDITAENMIKFGQGNAAAGITTPVPMGALCGAYYDSMPTDSGANTSLVSACDPTLALSGVTASVTGGSTTVTTTTSLSAGEVGQTWLFGSTSATETYSVMSGSGTSWTISPAWQGSNSSGLAILSSSLGGNLSVAQIHDIRRHILKYSSAVPAPLVGNIGMISANYAGPTGLAGQVAGLPGFYGYEWGFFSGDPYGRQQLAQDFDYHPEMAHSLNALLEMGQDAGISLVNFFNIGGARQGAQLYSSIFYQQQKQGTGSTNVYSTIQGGSPPAGAPNGGYGLATDAYNESVKLPVIQQWFAAANGAPPPSISVSPTGISASHTSPPIAITLTGTSTTWTSGSAISIQNSVTGTTTVAESSWTYISPTSSTLNVTTGAGVGQFTVTIDGTVSPLISVGAPPSISSNPTSIAASQASPPIAIAVTGTGTTWTSGSAVSIQNSVTGTTTVSESSWTFISATSSTLDVTTGAGTGEFTVTIDGTVSPTISVDVVIPPSISASPTSIAANQASPAIAIALTGTSTTWTSGSAISIQNSVTGTTTVAESSWTYISPTSSTLNVTTGAGVGQFTVTIDGTVSPAINVVTSMPPSMNTSPSSVVANQSSPPIAIALGGTGTAWTSGSSVSIQNSVTGTTTVAELSWTYISPTSSILDVTTGAGVGQFTVTIDGTVSPLIGVYPSPGAGGRRWHTPDNNRNCRNGIYRRRSF